MPLRRSDYENYDYREFWAEDKRYYEDCSERMALSRLLWGEESSNKVFIDIGCGFGRLFNEYSRFSRIVMVDYSLNNLKNARTRVNKFLAGYKGRVPSVLYVVSDAGRLPFKSGSSDIIMTVRVVHHLENPTKYFNEIGRILKKGGLYLLEFANKRNLKNILRFLFGKIDVSPFNTTPSQVGETIKNYHPKDIYKQLSSRNINIEKMISVSNYRVGFLKKKLGSRVLLFLENLHQILFPAVTLGPSIFLKARNFNETDNMETKNFQESDGILETSAVSQFIDLLACPGCSGDNFELDKDEIECKACSRVFGYQKAMVDFRL